jgi:predicted ATPase
MGALGDLPDGQREALRGAMGLSSANRGDRLACHAGVITLLALAGRHRPVLVVADDFQWFDVDSQEALVFAARRLGNDRGISYIEPQ